MASHQVLVTGATGFVGTNLCRLLVDRGFAVCGATRREARDERRRPDRVTFVAMGDLAKDPDWSAALSGCDTVVHLASHVHRPGESRRLAARRHDRVNRRATRTLLAQAAESGVKRFVYLSSLKVQGEASRTPLSEADAPAPGDAYAESKLDAERAVAEAGSRYGMEYVVLRPPLVYGPGVKANFLALLRAIRDGWPLPLASIENRRSLIYVENLADAIAHCVESPQAAGRTYLLSDGTAVSTPQLCRALGAALGRPVRLFPFPVPLLELAPPLRKLTRSFEVDDSAIRRELGWSPPYSFEEGIRATAEWFLKEQQRSRG